MRSVPPGLYFSCIADMYKLGEPDPRERDLYKRKSVTFFRSGKGFGNGGVDWAMQTARLNKTCRRTRQQPYCHTAPGTKHACDLWLATRRIVVSGS